jgi:hypothetical protein
MLLVAGGGEKYSSMYYRFNIQISTFLGFA